MGMLIALAGCIVVLSAAVVVTRRVAAGTGRFGVATVRLIEHGELLLAEVARFQPAVGQPAVARSMPGARSERTPARD